jgi:hypothetical protein
MTAFQKDQMRIMFTAMEIPYQKLRGERSNNLSYPYSAFKMTVRRVAWTGCTPCSVNRNKRSVALLCHCFAIALSSAQELLGNWEMLETMQLLRGAPNLSNHDAIFSKMCKELDWQFIPTTSAAPAAAHAAGGGRGSGGKSRSRPAPSASFGSAIRSSSKSSAPVPAPSASHGPS